MKDRRMDAYYYGFDKTGVDAIDKVLGAVACAGKSFHLTADWCDDCPPYDDHTGTTPVEWIQNAGKEAADEITRLRAQNAELLEALRDMLRLVEDDEDDPAPYLIDVVCDRARAAIAKVEGARNANLA